MKITVALAPLPPSELDPEQRRVFAIQLKRGRLIDFERGVWTSAVRAIRFVQQNLPTYLKLRIKPTLIELPLNPDGLGPAPLSGPTLPQGNQN